MPSTCRTSAGRFKTCGQRTRTPSRRRRGGHTYVEDAVARALTQHSKRWGVSPAAIGKAVYSGADDPGGWAPHALAVVHVEGMALPGPSLGPFSGKDHWLDWWVRVGETASKLHGRPLYFEHVNDAVVAVYPG